MNELLLDLQSRRAELIASMARGAFADDALRSLADLQGSIAAIEAILQSGLAQNVESAGAIDTD
jgi:hypothetical protein